MSGHELFLAAGSVNEGDDGLVWATVLPVGEWKLTPGPDGKPINKPLRVVEGRSQDPKVAVGLQDLADAFDADAVQFVTVPTTHADRVEDNTGYVKAVRIEDDPKLGKKALRAGFKFTEPLIKQKVMNGSIGGRSAGILFNYSDKETGRKYPAVLGHVALTNKPWIKGMPAWADLAASEDSSYVLAETAEEDAGEGPENAFEVLTDQLDEMSNGSLELVASDGTTAVVRDEDGDLWHAQVEDGKLAPLDDWDLVRVGSGESSETGEEANGPNGGDKMGKFDEMTADQLRQALAEKDAELEKYRASDRTAAVDARIEELAGQGFSEAPAFLQKVRGYLLADDGDVAAVMLSEDGRTPRNATLTDVVNDLVSAWPKPVVELAEQHEKREEGKRPPMEDADQMTARERADQMRESLGIQTDLIASK